MAFFPNGQQEIDNSIGGNTGEKYNAQSLKPENFTASGGTASGLQYSVNTARYPLAVGQNNDLKHYMVFFINVREKSKYIPRYEYSGIIAGKEIKPEGLRIADEGARAASQLLGTFIGAAVGTSVAGLLTKNLGNSLKAKAIKIGTAILGGAGGAGLGGSEFVGDLSKKFFEPSKLYRISDAIMLAVNEKPSVKYGVDYDGKDLGTFIGALAGATSTVDAITGKQGPDLARLIALNAAKVPQGIANLLGAEFALSDALQVGTGLAPNPFREQVFRNVETRTFRFDYRFFPRSPDEAKAVRDIIKQFKFHMHPEISEGGLFYVYPSTFDIAYYFNGTENQNIHRISSCVLERMSVDYGGGGWNTFNDGMPTEINMSLEFRELERLTKERIKDLDF